MLCHILNTIMYNFCPFIIRNKTAMNISLSRRCALNCKSFSICASVNTTVPLFDSIAEKVLSTCTPLHLPDSYKSTIESEYKSPSYKLWQYITKNKPSTCNCREVRTANKKYFYIQWVSVSNQTPQKKAKYAEKYTVQLSSINQKKWLLFSNNIFSHKASTCNSDWRDICAFTPHINTTKYQLTFTKNIFENNKIYNREKQNFALKSLTSRIFSDTIWHQAENLHKMNNYINENLNRWVYRL